MKIRQGFVSNSSSASFVILIKHLSELQIEALSLYAYSPENEDRWSIQVSDDLISGDTIMDNDAIDGFFKKIGVDWEIVEWESTS